MLRKTLPIVALGAVLLVAQPIAQGPPTTPSMSSTSMPSTSLLEPRVYLPLLIRVAPPETIDLVFEFGEVVGPAGESPEIAVAFHAMTCIDARGQAVQQLEFGTAAANALQGEGWFENQVDPEAGPFQWAGGPSGRARMALEIPGATEGLLFYILSASDALWMDVSINGELAATLRVEPTWHSGYVPHGEAVPETVPEAGPAWTEGRYFPSLPSTDLVYAFPMTTTFVSHYGDAWSPSWRLDDSYHNMMALTLVGMQGVINRTGPRVYLDWLTQWSHHAHWQDLLAEEVTVVPLDLDSLSTLHFLMRRYAMHFSGAVVYDPDLPDTINLATSLAGLADRIVLAPDQLTLPGMAALLEEMEARYTPDPRVSGLPTLPGCDCTIDLRALAQQEGWDATMQGQHDAYLWLYENLWEDLEQRIIGVISPGPPTSQDPRDPSDYWPLGLASRDWMVALRLPVIYLSPVDEPGAGLFHTVLEGAASPIFITGGVAGYEEEVTALASSHGDWQAALSWPGTILKSGNFSVFSGVRPDIVPYEPEMNQDRIWATLGDDPVATMFCTDGDALNYLIERGYYGYFGWEVVRDQRFGWTINPTLAEVAPVLWNYYVETREQASLVTGLSGAGYAYPQLMSTEELDGYLTHTARYLDDTGLRVVRIDGRKGHCTEQLATQYYENLSDHGYLGAIFGYGGPQSGMAFDYHGTPAPVTWPNFTIRGQNEISIAQQILDITPGDDLFDVGTAHISPDCEIVPDPGALNGYAALVDTSFATAPSCCLAVSPGTMSVPPGTYTVTFRMKVTDTADTDGFAAIYVGEQPENWQTIVYQGLAPDDFDQAGVYQTFDLSFTLDEVTPELEVRIDYFLDSTDLYVDTIRVVRGEGAALPFFANALIGLIIDPSEFEYQTRAPERFTNAFEAGGGTVLKADEYIAALNPAFMIEWATPILGSGHPALVEASTLLAEERFLKSLLAVREGLKDLPQQTFRLEVDFDSEPRVVEVQANCWIDDLRYDASSSTINFRTHGPPDRAAEPSLVVPEDLMASPFTVAVDGETVPARALPTVQGAELRFAVGPGAHLVRVQGAP